MLPQNKPYFIAETAFHHEGDADFLIKLIEDLVQLDVDAIKFHMLFDIEDYIIKGHPAVEVLQKISLKKDQWEKILKKVSDSGKKIILLTNDVESLQWVNSVQEKFPIEAVELHSTGLNDIFLLNECKNFNKTVILGSGGSTFDEIQFAIDYLEKSGKNDVLLMHGFQNYPTDYADINFNRMNLLMNSFNVPVGYADHTDPADSRDALVSVLPIAMGINVIEKHVTNVFGEKRIDSQAAVSLEKMMEIINLGNDVWKARGKSNYELSDAEKNYGNTGPMKKAIVAKRRINQGAKLSLEDIAFKRTEHSSPLLQKDIFKIIGAVANREIEADEIISFDNVKYEFKKENFDQFFVSNKQD